MLKTASLPYDSVFCLFIWKSCSSDYSLWILTYKYYAYTYKKTHNTKKSKILLLRKSVKNLTTVECPMDMPDSVTEEKIP